MKIGFDTDATNQSLCAAKTWNEKDITASFLLFSYGTIPNPNSICPDAKERTIKLCYKLLQDQFENLICSNEYNDLNLAAIKLSDCLNTCNKRICEISNFLGQGIYVGGGILYTIHNDFLLISFGGTVVYLWDCVNIKKLEPKNNDHLIRNVLGGNNSFNAKYATGNLKPGMKLLIFSDLLNPETCIQQINAVSSPYSNTLSMSLRRELDKKGKSPSAVLEIECE